MRSKQFRYWVPMPRLRFRSRFKLRTLLMVVAFSAIALTFLYHPQRSAKTVVALPVAPASATPADARVFAETHAELLRSPYLINRALRDPKVQQLEVIKGLRAPQKWIQSNLDVTLSEKNNGRTADMTLTTRDGESRELKIILQAISHEFQRGERDFKSPIVIPAPGEVSPRPVYNELSSTRRLW